MAEDVKIILQQENNEDGEDAENEAKVPSTSMNSGMKTGCFSSRIPRFNRRASAADVAANDLNNSKNASFDSMLNKSYDTSMFTITERGLKRHHSISERGECGKQEDFKLSISQASTLLSPLSPRRAKSPTSSRRGLNPAAVKRHKSFSVGERPSMKRTPIQKPVLFEPPRSSSPTPSPSTRRGGTIQTIDIARKEGIINIKATTRTTAVADPGRVQVFVRIRPLNTTEDTTKHPLAINVADEESTQLKLFDGKNDRCYQFDGVLSDTTDNKQVYKTVGEPLVYSALSGFNGILMCYGQTGTGKTFTLMSNDGMSVRIIYQCFKVVNADIKHKYTVTCSYLQIYQEKLYDLLNETRTVELSLREHPKTGVYIENLTEYVVHSPKEVLNLLKVGKRRLVFAETKMNRASSRSHAICQLKILKERVGNDSVAQSNSPCYSIKTPDFSDEEDYYDHHDQLGHSIDASYQSLIDDEDEEDILSNVTQLEDGVTSVHGKLYICDLAGSERIKKTKASGERLQEAQHINSSLLELGNVIQALADGNRSHVPFRNSTLTRLLQEGLSGNCKTRLVVCCAPTVQDIHETKCSLNFGSRAMKIQVMAHVNYEVDYKKLAEALAAKLETLEQEWDVQKKDYEKFIQHLKLELGNRRIASPMESAIVGSKGSLKQAQSLLVTELMTLQLFYNLQANAHLQTAESDILMFSSDDQNLMLQSMEGLLELLSDYMCDEIPSRAKNYSNMSSSGHSSVITSPDYIEQAGSSCFDVPSTLEPVARFLEHAQITTANLYDNLNRRNEQQCEKGSTERFRRVMNSLVKIKETVSKRAVIYLKSTLEKGIDESEESTGKFDNLQNVIKMLDSRKDLLINFESLDDVQTLENSLYCLLMDKALLSCLLLLKTQASNLYEDWSSKLPSVETCGSEVKRMLEELTTERRDRDKLQDTVYTLREEQVVCEEKLKDIELELKTVRELKESLESKLHVVENKNFMYEEQIAIAKVEQATLEKKLANIDVQHKELEALLKNSDNNNARKERLIVDLKNEKVALDSLVCTLKEEITILEKERARDFEEKRRIEEELEDLKDRNIILETEWSCCREENGLLENELIAMEEDKAILEDEVLKYRDDVKMLEEAVSMLEAQAADYKQDVVSLRTKEERLLANVRVEKEKFNKELNALRQEMSTLRVERRRFQRDISVSRADKSNTERAYNALKVQKDALQDDVSSYKQEEKRLQREIMMLKSDRTKLERDVNTLKNENVKLKQELVQADKIKNDLKLLQKNEERITILFGVEKDKLIDSLCTFKEKFNRMEQDFSKVCAEKDKLMKQLKRYEESSNNTSTMRRSQSQPTTGIKTSTPDKKMKASMSVQGALVRRSVHSGEVSEVEGKVLDLQRRLAFFMAEKEDIQKELITTRERNAKLTLEIKCLEDDTSNIQVLLSTLSEEKQSLVLKLSESALSRDILQKEKDELKQAVDSAQKVALQLRKQLDQVAEENRTLEVNQMTIRDSVKTLQNETVVLATENEHLKAEFEAVDKELVTTRSIVQSLNGKLSELKIKVREAGEKDTSLTEQVSVLEIENLSLTDQVGVCQQQEELLVYQLLTLNQKFHALETTVENVVGHDGHLSAETLAEVENLKSKNWLLEQTISGLKIQLGSLELDAKKLKKEREEIETLLKDSDNEKSTLRENIQHLKSQVLRIKNEKIDVEEKMTSLEAELKTVGGENVLLRHTVMDKSHRLEQEKCNYKAHIDKLQQQIEELVKERILLEAELEFLKNQNEQLRREIVIILEDNEKLEVELGGLEDVFHKQEEELGSATEETKVLLRQLCSVEVENLNLCTKQSLQQDDVDDFKKQVDQLKLDKERLGNEKLYTDVQAKTLRERLLMAELEISKLKSDHATVESQRRMLVDDLDAADQERSLLKSELHGLARALSPLKKDVTDVVRKQESLQNEINQDAASNVDISIELLRIKEDLCTFNAEKAALDCEQCDLENRLRNLNGEKGGLRRKLRNLIQDLDAQNSATGEVTEMEESIQMISRLITKKDDLEQDERLLTHDLIDTQYTNQVLNVCLINSTDELRCAQEELCIATVERLKLKDKVRQIDGTVSEIQSFGLNRRSGLSPLHEEVYKLKKDIGSFEVEQLNLLQEVRVLNEQLDMAENNLINTAHFKIVIEKILCQYKERNSKLESHLRVIYNDLLHMEAQMEKTPSNGAKLLLETLELHQHFQLLEDDLRTTEFQNRNLKEDASDLLERCTALEEEKHMNTVSSGYLHEGMDGQHSLIAQLQKEKEVLSYEKIRLQTKLSFHKDDKKRILEDSQRINKNLGAYAKYTQQLERKLEALKIDLSDLKSTAKFIDTKKIDLAGRQALGENTGILCERCVVSLNRKFHGVHSNTQLLGEELLDCITDNLALETAIFSFMEQKAKLEREVVAVETEHRDLERKILNGPSNLRLPDSFSILDLDK